MHACISPVHVFFFSFHIKFGIFLYIYVHIILWQPRLPQWSTKWHISYISVCATVRETRTLLCPGQRSSKLSYIRNKVELKYDALLLRGLWREANVCVLPRIAQVQLKSILWQCFFLQWGLWIINVTWILDKVASGLCPPVWFQRPRSPCLQYGTLLLLMLRPKPATFAYMFMDANIRYGVCLLLSAWMDELHLVSFVTSRNLRSTSTSLHCGITRCGGLFLFPQRFWVFVGLLILSVSVF